MKARVPLTGAQKRAMNKEINRQIFENNQEYLADVEAMCMIVLHEHFGFGQKRLLKFRSLFIKEAKALKAHYEIDDITYPAKSYLKKIGVDVVQLIKQEED